ncbi:hypothetical protein OROGR_022952 [Orobanche gracilis]
MSLPSNTNVPLQSSAASKRALDCPLQSTGSKRAR